MRPISVQVERHVLRWRTLRGGATAEKYLNLLAVALEPRGWRLVRLYRSQGFPLPVLWVYASGPDDHVGLGVVALAVPAARGATTLLNADGGAIWLPAAMPSRRPIRLTPFSSTACSPAPW
ncbi:hypothetical protein [Actinomadura sp. 3N407]|uniref:hypothetical protein n=1 Tax=Actinomadura sp. 3N407 TaxID=3457423 RepID=UPI003FCE52BF